MKRQRYRWDEFDMTPGVQDGELLARKAATELAALWNEADPAMEAEVLMSAITGTNKVFIVSKHESGPAAMLQWTGFWDSPAGRSLGERWKAAQKPGAPVPVCAYRWNLYYPAAAK